MAPYTERDGLSAIRIDDMQRVIVQFCPEIRDSGWYTLGRAYVCRVPEHRVLAEIDTEIITRGEGERE